MIYFKHYYAAADTVNESLKRKNIIFDSDKSYSKTRGKIVKIILMLTDTVHLIYEYVSIDF